MVDCSKVPEISPESLLLLRQCSIEINTYYDGHGNSNIGDCIQCVIAKEITLELLTLTKPVFKLLLIRENPPNVSFIIPCCRVYCRRCPKTIKMKLLLTFITSNSKNCIIK